jgi:hypothetical protein
MDVAHVSFDAGLLAGPTYPTHVCGWTLVASVRRKVELTVCHPAYEAGDLCHNCVGVRRRWAMLTSLRARV